MRAGSVHDRNSRSLSNFARSVEGSDGHRDRLADWITVRKVNLNTRRGLSRIGVHPTQDLRAHADIDSQLVGAACGVGLYFDEDGAVSARQMLGTRNDERSNEHTKDRRRHDTHHSTVSDSLCLVQQRAGDIG